MERGEDRGGGIRSGGVGVEGLGGRSTGAAAEAVTKGDDKVGTGRTKGVRAGG
jgi:hypothetical protein